MTQLAKSVKYLLKTKISIASIIFGAIFIGGILLYLCSAFLYVIFDIYCGAFMFNYVHVLLVLGLMCYVVYLRGNDVKYMLLNGVNRKTLIISRAIVITIYFAAMLLFLFGFQAIIVALRSDPMSQFGFWGLIENIYESFYSLAVAFCYYALALMFCISLVNLVSSLSFGKKEVETKKSLLGIPAKSKSIFGRALILIVSLALPCFAVYLIFLFSVNILDFNDYKIYAWLFTPILYVGSFVWQYFRLRKVAV